MNVERLKRHALKLLESVKRNLTGPDMIYSRLFSNDSDRRQNHWIVGPAV